MNLNIITPVSRRENLPHIHSSIFIHAPKELNITWYIVLDDENLDHKLKFEHTKMLAIPSRDRSVSGNIQRNLALHAIALNNYPNGASYQGYVYYLDDDNILHPDYFKLFMETLDKSYTHAMIGHQEFKNGATRLLGKPENTRLCQIDTAQYTLPFSMIGDARWKHMEYTADGIFIESIYNANKKSFKFVNKTVCYYNYLRKD